MKNIFKLMGLALMAGTLMTFASCGEDDPNNPGTGSGVVAKYTITVTSADNAKGTVAINPVKSEYSEGDTVTITATPNNGYSFENWNGGITANPYTFTVKENAAYTANFTTVHVEDGRYTITFNGDAWEPAACYVMDYTAEGYMVIMAAKNATSQLPYVQGLLETAVGSWTYETSQGDYMIYRGDEEPYTCPIDYFDPETGDTLIAAGTYYRWNADRTTFTENITAVDLNALTMSCTWSEQCFDIEQLVNSMFNDYGTTVTLSGEMVNYHWTWYTGKQNIFNGFAKRK